MALIRVATYNILRGGRRGVVLGEAVRALEADVLLVNESPKTPILWSGRCRRLVDGWRLRLTVGGRPAGSNLIASGTAVGVKRVGSERLRQPWFQPIRGIAWAQLRVESRLLGVVACHLSLDRARRLLEIDRVIEVATSLRGPVVVAGDLNESPGGTCWRRLHAAGFVDHGDDTWATYPAERPTARIDALLVRGPDVTVHRHGDPGVPAELLARASDHRPVLAVLDIG